MIRLRWTGIVMTVALCAVVSCGTATGVYHVVKEGQTLYRISKEYRVEETYLARINNIRDPKELQVGKRLFIPGATRAIDVPVTVSNSVPSKPNVYQPQPTKKTSPKSGTPTSTPVPVSKPSATPPPVTTASKDRFTWPLKGKILRCFSEQGKEPCKGIEISTPLDTPVKAAAAGSVIYSGDGIRGYGNLIIIKHDDSYFTVYGYNRRNQVRNGAFVSKGQTIAYSGAPPGGGAPRLHFEIRHGKKSVDPARYLP